MAEERDPLDPRLAALFAPLDLSDGFDARLMARVHAESKVLESEERDYHRAMRAAARRRRRLLEFLTLDAAAVAGLLIFGETLLVRLLPSLPAGVRGSALWQVLADRGATGLLILIPLAVAAAMLWPAFDYGRSPE
jgi:hypothetical protein